MQINMINNIQFTIASAASCQASRWKNAPTTWEAVAYALSNTVRTDETIAQYFAYSKDKQDKIKDVGGFVGGTLLGGPGQIITKDGPKQIEYSAPYGWRRKGYVQDRQLVALDVDFGDFGAWFDFKELGFAGLMYTTHKHQPSSPRFRIVFPLDRPVGPDEYEAIARKVASWIDIEIFDDTTYQPTRLMYFPSTAKDGEFCYDLHDVPVVSADGVLATYEGDWRDWSNWPTSSREQSRRRPQDEAESPADKQGIVGAFCRAYDIEDAIAEFLPDVYEHCPALGPNRWSFIGGSTSGGLIVYGDGFAYSHHNTDPAGQRLCNSFDLVRLHKFGELDNGLDVADIAKAPSYKAMSHFANDLGEVKKAMILMRRDRMGDGSEYDELEREAVTVAYSDDWISQLETEGKGVVKSTINNVVLILRFDRNLIDRFAYNEFEKREIVTQPLPWDKPGVKFPRPVEDTDDAQLRWYLERVYGINAVGKTLDALTVVLQENSVHPLRQYLDACEWDGVERVDSLFIDLFGADDTAYTRAVTRKWMCAAVARVYVPGIKFDYMIVLVGDEGTGKSSTLDRLGGEWYNGNLPAIGTTAALEAIAGSWIVEAGELEGLNRADVGTIKHFISTRIDQYRVAYGKRKAVFPRTCVFGGTTNEAAFLKSVTGNRKFWVINFLGKRGEYWWSEYLTPGIVAQVWAEARELFSKGEQLYLPGDLEAEARDIQNAHLETDDRAGLIKEYLDRVLPDEWEQLDPVGRRMWLSDRMNVNKGVAVRKAVSIIEVWTECLGRQMEDISRRDSQDLGRVLRALPDWRAVEGNGRRIAHYGLQRLYERVVTGQ